MITHPAHLVCDCLHKFSQHDAAGCNARTYVAGGVVECRCVSFSQRPEVERALYLKAMRGE